MRANLQRLGVASPLYATKSPAEREGWIGDALRVAALLDPAGEPPPSKPPAPRAAPAPPKPKARPSPPAPRAGARRNAPFLRPGQGLTTPLAEIGAIDVRLLKRLAKLNLETVEDLLFHFPRRHLDFTSAQPIRELTPGSDRTVAGDVMEAKETRMGRGGRMRACEAVIGDATGWVRAVWFNQPYLAKTLRGSKVALSGRVSNFRGRIVFENPEWEVIGGGEQVHTGGLIPIYPLTEGITSRRLRTLIRRALDEAGGALTDFLPPELRRRLKLGPLAESVAAAHFPPDQQAKQAARRRLAFDELLLIQIGVLERKRSWQRELPGRPLLTDRAVIDGFIASLGFEPTSAQRKALDHVTADLARSVPMTRLLQGDVGSGKTVVALAALLTAAANRQQSAFMAPTEILAEQHFATVRKLFGRVIGMFGEVSAPGQAPEVLRADLPYMDRPITFGLLTGSTTRKRKQEILTMTESGEIDVLIGTHALIQKEVAFASLGLVIVDEQHRFGVMQRAELRQKGYNPHLLVMTATPIPRSLSLTVFGDLDVSTIDEMPPGRLPIKTHWFEMDQRDTAYGFMRREIEKGRQAFMIYPLIEESEKLEAAAAEQEYERLKRDVFPDLKLGLLHGRLSSAEKDRVMRQFRDAEIDILLSTAVVEVGIDVPNATVMVIESADRFGLSQLHQFRGRVGRGEYQSHCILISETGNEDARERLHVMRETSDGFALAEEDLRLRGPGEFFGTRQAGIPDLRMARLSDVKMIELAREEAAAIAERDPHLEAPEHRALGEAVRRWWRGREAAHGEA